MLLTGLGRRRALMLGLAGAAACALAAVWYVLAYRQAGSIFLSTVFSENVARFTGTMQEEGNPHAHSIFYLLGTLAAGMLPWTPLLLLAPWRAWAERRKALSLRGALRAARESRSGRFLLFSISAVVVVTAFYAVPASKRSVYLLPIYPFLCLFTAYLIRLLAARYPDRLRRAVLALAAVLLAASAGLALLMLGYPDISRFTARPEKAMELGYYRRVMTALPAEAGLWQIALLLLVPALAAAALAARRHARLCPQLALAAFFTALAAADGVLLPHMARSVSGRGFAREIQALLKADEPLVSYRLEAYGVDFYLGGRVDAEGLSACEAGACQVLLKQRDLEQLRRETAGRYDAAPLAESKHGIGNAKDVLLLLRLSRRG